LFKEFQLVLVTSAQASKQLQDLCTEKYIQLITGNDLVDWIVKKIPFLSKNTKHKLSITEVPDYIG